MRTQALSFREREVLALMAEGLENREIAARLVISVRTAESHKRNIIKRLDLDSTRSLYQYAHEGLIR